MRWETFGSKGFGLGSKSSTSGLTGADRGCFRVGWAFESLDLGRQRTIVDALMTITVNPVTKGSKVFEPDAIDLPWRVPVRDG